MATDVDICNHALLRIGNESIASLAEQSRAAEACNAFYNQDRQALLQGHPWSFALKRAALVATANTPEDFAYEYPLPADSLRPVRLFPLTVHEEPFLVRTGFLYCDVADVTLEYIEDVMDTTRFGPLFIDALAYRLAADLILALSGDAAMQQAMYRLYLTSFRVASREDAQGHTEALGYQSELLESRN